MYWREPVQSNIKFRYDPSNFEMNDLAPAQGSGGRSSS
jgi:hypothetical protein